MDNSFIKLNAVICGSEESNDELKKQFNQIGIGIYFLKTISILPLPIADISILDKEYDYTIFTSKHSVTCFFDLLKKNNKQLVTKKVICIGKKTKEVCLTYGDFNIDVPIQNSSSGIFTYFLNKYLIDKLILIPGSKISNLWYVDRLKTNGADVKFIPVYDNIATKRDELLEVLEQINKSKIDLFIFTSPSAFNNLVEIERINDINKYFNDKIIAAIGDVTKKGIEEKGLKVDIVPENFNFNDLIKSIEKFYLKTEKNENV